MKVRNINGTTNNKCKCGSWLEHWKNFSNQKLPGFCPEINCIEKDLVGAHVQKESKTDNNWYIVPLCAKHNAKRGETIEITDTVALVSANTQETCK